MQEKLLKFVEQSNVEIGGRSGFIFNEKKGQDKLREREYNSELMRLYVVGGGGCMIQNFGEYDKSRVTIVRDMKDIVSMIQKPKRMQESETFL